MKLFITHDSALAYWQSAYCRRTATNAYWKHLPSLPLARETIDFELLARKGISVNPLHITVGKHEQLIRRQNIRAHTREGPVLSGSFEPLPNLAGPLDRDIQVATPELAFCQTALHMEFAETVLTGYELCAGYRKNPFTGDTDKRDPLTTARALQDYAARYDRQPGAKAARRAARYVCPGKAASPMEVALAMLLTLPRMEGGYGLPQAVLNGEVVIPGRDRKADFLAYHGDLVWPEQRLVVEYDSNLYHRDPAQLAIDAERRNAMQDAGWRVTTITWSQVLNPGKMDIAAAQLARALGVKNYYLALHTPERRAALRKLVLPPEMQPSNPVM